jgi:hypothetical protein
MTHDELHRARGVLATARLVALDGTDRGVVVDLAVLADVLARV